MTTAYTVAPEPVRGKSWIMSSVRLYVHTRLTQWLEFLFYTQGVVGSNPTSSTNNAEYSSGELAGLISQAGKP